MVPRLLKRKEVVPSGRNGEARKYLILEPASPLLVGPGEVHSAAVALEALLVVVVVLVQALCLCKIR